MLDGHDPKLARAAQLAHERIASIDDRAEEVRLIADSTGCSWKRLVSGLER